MSFFFPGYFYSKRERHCRKGSVVQDPIVSSALYPEDARCPPLFAPIRLRRPSRWSAQKPGAVSPGLRDLSVQSHLRTRGGNPPTPGPTRVFQRKVFLPEKRFLARQDVSDRTILSSTFGFNNWLRAAQMSRAKPATRRFPLRFLLSSAFQRFWVSRRIN